LETAGIKASVAVDNEIEIMVDSLDRGERMGILKENKKSLTVDERIWENSIHVVLGNYPKEDDLVKRNAMGILDGYHNPEYECTWFDWLWTTFHRGSGPLDTIQVYLDGCGCFVFAKRIATFPGGLKIDLQKAVALTVAHEIGHALGMNHYSQYATYNVMYPNVYEAFTKPFEWRYFREFSKKSLDGRYSNEAWDGMNLRHVVGINTVNLKEF